MKIWLDDVRTRPDDSWIVCKSYDQVVALFAVLSTVPERMSFDHDLGGEKDGYDVIKWIANNTPHLYPEVVTVHSANGPGAENIEKYDEWFRRVRDED